MYLFTPIKKKTRLYLKSVFIEKDDANVITACRYGCGTLSSPTRKHDIKNVILLHYIPILSHLVTNF